MQITKPYIIDKNHKRKIIIASIIASESNKMGLGGYNFEPNPWTYFAQLQVKVNLHKIIKHSKFEMNIIQLG